ncbi:hypothetical protein ABPG75_006150 [Micractinium tetrahymenae]
MQRATCVALAQAAPAAPRWRPLAARRGGLLALPGRSRSSSSSGRRPAAPAAALPSPLELPASSSSSSGLELLAAQPRDLLLSTHVQAALLGDLAEGLEAPVQLAYLVTLMGFLVVGAYLVVRQVLIRRELEEAAKVLGERVRTGEATSEDYFELGVILLRKKLYTQATKNLEKAQKGWQGEPEELAQVHNALGYAFFNMEKTEAAIAEYRKAVQLQPSYVTAWNNLGDAYERKKAYGDALAAYQEALTYAPDNKVAQARAEYCRTRLARTA